MIVCRVCTRTPLWPRQIVFRPINHMAMTISRGSKSPTPQQWERTMFFCNAPIPLGRNDDVGKEPKTGIHPVNRLFGCYQLVEQGVGSGHA